MQFVYDNKEWILSGIGISIITFVIKIIIEISQFVVNKFRYNRTPAYKFLKPYEIDNCERYISQFEEPTKEFLKNCCIKNHTTLLKILKHNLKPGKYLIWIDIDKFTQINKLFGKEFGNEVINVIICIMYFISKIFQAEIYHAKNRDEFFCIIDKKNIADDCAKTIISLIQQYEWYKLSPSMYITCSAGIASYRNNPIDTMQRARASVNLMKLGGGNGVGPEIIKLHPYELPSLSSS